MHSVKEPARNVQENSVIGTNNSSIVSKRSVERLYYPEPHFFRYFVKKPQRRSPLINRGYWLRMYAVDNVVRDFLQCDSPKKKVILNLGCGYDPLPFQWMSKDSKLCKDTTFVDVDFPQLISRKADIIETTPQLLQLLTNFERVKDVDGLHFRSDNYHGIGCDLANVSQLDQVLGEKLQLFQCMVLCTAEVSVTYMNVEAADALIAWCARFEDMRFCLLEQFLPVGDHPFAQKMIEHFNKLQTPLRNISKYPGQKDQVQRFKRCNWPAVRVRSLWNVWSEFVENFPAESKHFEAIEMFDEWEEYVLFAAHYFLLVAQTFKRDQQYGNNNTIDIDSNTQVVQKSQSEDEISWPLTLQPCITDKPSPPRKFGAIFRSRNAIGLHGGMDGQQRSNTTELMSLDTSLQNNGDGVALSNDGNVLPKTVAARMCHSIATSVEGRCLLTGGRASPDRAMRDCWYLEKCWKRVHDLPFPLFRHCSTWIDSFNDDLDEPGVLLYGGKTNGNTVSDQWLFWRKSKGWETMKCLGASAKPVFGACIACIGGGSGLITGGMAENGLISSQLLAWKLCDEDGQLYIHTIQPEVVRPEEDIVLSRFGAQLVAFGSTLALVGGIAETVLCEDQEVLRIIPPAFPGNAWTIEPVRYQRIGPRPVFVGHSVSTFNESLIVWGGGAVCFSFGAVWNGAPLCLGSSLNGSASFVRLEEKGVPNQPETQVGAHLQSGVGSSSGSLQASSSSEEHSPPDQKVIDSQVVSIMHLTVPTSSAFMHILNDRQPVIMQGLELGHCLQSWGPLELKNKIGSGREVVVHESTEAQMNFLTKNFDYRKTSFGSFIDEILGGSPHYLRSLSSEKPFGQPANITLDYPELTADFNLPSQLDYVDRNLHSSVLRVSGPVKMWLHYDVLANVLCQIVGSKRLLLYPPSDVLHAAIPAGASSSPIAVFDKQARIKYPGFKLMNPHEVVLRPGEVLLIPPLWLHAAQPLENVSISVNVFFRDLEIGYATGKDVYGNRDIQAYEKSRNDINKVAHSFDKLPDDMAQFYLLRLADELKQRALERG